MLKIIIWVGNGVRSMDVGGDRNDIAARIIDKTVQFQIYMGSPIGQTNFS